MVRSLILHPVFVALTAAAGLVACSFLSWNPHPRELALAAGVLLVASEMAMLPILLTRGANQLAVSQAALVGSMVHLFTAAIAIFVLTSSKPFTYWLLALYAATLVSVSMACVKAVRSAPIATGSSNTVSATATSKQ